MLERDPLKAGQHLGRYELLQPIAQGGMGTVWVARLAGTRGFQKLVAVKALLPEIRKEPGVEQMFMREASIASRIRHPNVVETFDAGEDKGVLYVVMQWVHGEPLSSIITVARERGGMPFAMGVRIGIQTCEGLHAAHELTDEEGNPTGLVHRDVSPHNILVGYNGEAKVTDFGIARFQSESDDEAVAGSRRLKGKLGYMAPEQIRLEPLDRRADVFAAGIVLYIATTGRHPFRQPQQRDVLRVLCEVDPVPPTTFVPGYPRRLEQVILRALAKDRKHRFATAHEFGDELARAFPPAMDRQMQHELQEYLRALLPQRLEEHRKLVRLAFGTTAGRPGSAALAGTAQSSSTLRAVAVSSATSGAPRPDPAPSESEETLPFHPTPRASRLGALAAIVGVFALVVAGAFVVRPTPFSGAGASAWAASTGFAGVTHREASVPTAEKRLAVPHQIISTSSEPVDAGAKVASPPGEARSGAASGAKPGRRVARPNEKATPSRTRVELRAEDF